jgi:2-keto-4-pentenoate hydratase/2-oxohepta-3-ene-1,7-dioic acid hydratase in catechol pathway
MIRAFSFTTEQNEPRIGIDTDEGRFDFTLIWEFFKDFKNFRQAPRLNFLQVMVEMDYFSQQTFEEVLEIVKGFRSLNDVRLDDSIRLDVPIARPQKILCLGRNYRAHAEEWGSEVPTEPMFFAKLTSALLPHQGEILIPDGIGRVDHEIELAIVIGKTAKRVPVSQAMEHVAGYTIGNDVSARDVQHAAMRKKHPWTLSKGLDTFCPMGPFLVPADAIDDPHALDLELRVNDEIKQKSNTRNMIFKIPELIAYISKNITLYAGDLILTGTPEGTLPIQPGDRIEARVEHCGTLVNRVGAI